MAAPQREPFAPSKVIQTEYPVRQPHKDEAAQLPIDAL